MKEEPTDPQKSSNNEAKTVQRPISLPDGRARSEMLRHFRDPFHPSDRNPLRRWFRMTGGRCSGGGGPC